MDSDAATMTRTIRRLENAGFVRRLPYVDDKRATLIEPTDASHALRHQVEDLWQQLEEISAGGLDKDERQTILRALEGAPLDGPPSTKGSTLQTRMACVIHNANCRGRYAEGLHDPVRPTMPVYTAAVGLACRTRVEF